MTTIDLLKKYPQYVDETIKSFKKPFDSHDFIEKFIHYVQTDYAKVVYDTKKKDAFKYVHSQIGRFLSKNSQTLGLEKLGKVNSRNIFGRKNSNQEWINKK